MLCFPHQLVFGSPSFLEKGNQKLLRPPFCLTHRSVEVRYKFGLCLSFKGLVLGLWKWSQAVSTDPLATAAGTAWMAEGRPVSALLSCPLLPRPPQVLREVGSGEHGPASTMDTALELLQLPPNAGDPVEQVRHWARE